MFERVRLKRVMRKLTLDGMSLDTQADRTIQAYKLVIAIIEREQWLRSFAPRKEQRGGVSNISSMTLAAHKGWAGRVIKTCESLKANAPFTVNDARTNIMNKGIQDLSANQALFLVPPRDNIVWNLVAIVRNQIALYKFRKQEEKRRKLEIEMLERLKSLPSFEEECEEEGHSAVILFDDVQKTPAGSEVEKKTEQTDTFKKVDNGTPNAQV